MTYYQTLQPIFIEENYATFVNGEKEKTLDKGVFLKIISISESLFFSKTTYGKIIIPGYYSLHQDLDKVDISNLLLEEHEDKVKIVTYEYVVKNMFKPHVFDCQCTIAGSTTSLNEFLLEPSPNEFLLEPCQIHKILGLSYLRDKRDRIGFDFFTKKELLFYFIQTIKEYRGKSYILPTNLFKMSRVELINYAPHWLR